MFIGCINYYWDMWQRHALLLKPLTNHSDLKKHWADEMQRAFDKMFELVAADAFTAYPDHKRF
jgi:hypothetical protein